MGKAAYRRKKRRQNYFKLLSLNQPELFREEWGLRIESWTKKIIRESNMFVYKSGKKVGSVYEIVGYALNELKACGEKAFQMEAEDTEIILTEECNKAIARIVEPRMHRLLSNYPHMEDSKKPGIHQLTS